MIIATPDELAARAARDWTYEESVREQLKALGRNPSPEDVDEVIGNSSWTEIICTECLMLRPAVLFDLPEKGTVLLCAECLDQARCLLVKG